MIAKKSCRAIFIDLTGSEGEDEGYNVSLRGFDQITVDQQEREGREVSDPLIPV